MQSVPTVLEALEKKRWREKKRVAASDLHIARVIDEYRVNVKARVPNLTF